MVEVSQPGPFAEGGCLAFHGCFQSVWMWNCSFQAFHLLYNVQGEPRWPNLCFGWCTMPPEPWLSAEVRCLQAVGNTSHPQRKGCKEEETKLGFKSRQSNPFFFFFFNKIASGGCEPCLLQGDLHCSGCGEDFGLQLRASSWLAPS